MAQQIFINYRRKLNLLAAVLLASLAMPPPPAIAQSVREHDATSVRGFHTPDGRPATRIRRSFQSDGEARAVLREVLAAAGLQGLEDRIILRATADTPAAEAFMEKDERLIAYNAVFMQSLRQKTNEYWSLVAVLAHEVGHHVRFHTVIAGRNHEFELEADYQAGFILRRMGATLEQAQAAFRLFPEVASATHPGRAERMQQVTLGWVDGGERRPSVLPGLPGARGDTAAEAASQQAPVANTKDAAPIGTRSMPDRLKLPRPTPTSAPTNCKLILPEFKVIEVTNGDQLCDTTGRYRARVERIGSGVIRFTQDAGAPISCNAHDVCQFEWASAPFFRITAEADEARGIAPRGTIRPR